MGQADALRSAGRLPERRYTLVLSATIFPDGRLKRVEVTQSSGDLALDGAATRAFFQSQPLPLPQASDLVDGVAIIRDIRLEVDGTSDPGPSIPSGDRTQELLDRLEREGP